ncbi:Rop family plasmid primer RNA-binding protein [Salmonella enterica]|uniref:Rop family plasmid primer RNA-binding protein n=1 Tax=Salmonella enterica TaxID=28901 RepID=UPI0022B6F5B8|nr:Rop family plasmid primer RNA-binding protein [Salmonella enterica]MCZ7198011.1 Rop family plasmid primer RNA-binding protein [Salmonella enterica]
MKGEECGSVKMDKFMGRERVVLVEKIEEVDVDEGGREWEKLEEEGEKVYEKVVGKVE